MLKPRKNYKTETSKNLMILELLTIVPEFQRDVEKVRKEFNINDSGFRWLSTEMFEWSSKKKIRYYQIEIDSNGEIDNSRHYRNQNSIRKDFPSNSFEKRLLELGLKYRLPFNFYAFPYTGISRFILSNEIKTPPSNYDISFSVNENSFSWASLIIYAPPSKEELKEINNELKNNFEMLKHFSKGYDIVFGNTKNRKNLERDIILLNEQKERKGKPKKIEIYDSEYLSSSLKSKDTSPKRKRKLKRDYKQYIKTEFSEPTSKEIGAKYDVSAEVTRKSKERINSSIKKLFGYDLEL